MPADKKNIYNAGWRPETEKTYRPAVEACMSILHLHETVSDIARAFGVAPIGLLQVLREHFPDVLPMRTDIQKRLRGITKGRHGAARKSLKQYAQAVALVRDQGMSIAEAARQCRVSFTGLRAHITFYHTDLRDRWMADKKETGQKSTQTRKVNIHQKYAEALRLYKGSALTLGEICSWTGVQLDGFYWYLRKHQPDAIRQRSQSSGRPKTHSTYATAESYLETNDDLSEAARLADRTQSALRGYLRRNRPDILQRITNNKSSKR